MPQQLGIAKFEPLEAEAPALAIASFEPLREDTTALSDADERTFHAWATKNQIADVDHPDSHYDYRGYWQATKGAAVTPGQHFPDTFKQHGHPTFSIESQYSTGPSDGGHWVGEQFIPPPGHRPAPVAARGVTQPESVQVTTPPAPVNPFVNEPPTLDIARRFTGLQPLTVKSSTVPDPLSSGVQQVTRGFGELAKGIPPVGVRPPGPLPKQSGDELLSAGADLLEGAIKVGTPLLVTSLVWAPLRTAIIGVAADLTAKGGEQVTKELGGSDAAQRFVGAVAGAIGAGIIGTDEVAQWSKATLHETAVATKAAGARAKAARAAKGAPTVIPPDENVIDVQPVRPPPAQLPPGPPEPAAEPPMVVAPEPPPPAPMAPPAAAAPLAIAKVEPLEESHAVQEQGGNALDVRQQTRDGEAVGGRHAEPAQPAGTRPQAEEEGVEGPLSALSVTQLHAIVDHPASHEEVAHEAVAELMAREEQAPQKPAEASTPPQELTPASEPAKPTHLRAFDVLAQALNEKGPDKAFPKNAGEFRRWIAMKVGKTPEQLAENIDDINDAAEAALADYFRKHVGGFEPDEQLRVAKIIEGLLPRAHRTLEKSKLQQFSTPLPIALMASRAAQLRSGDIVMEPTAGTGNLIAAAAARGDVSIVAHELSDRRGDLLDAQGYRVVRGDYLRDKSIAADVIIANPPWGKYSTGKYGKAVGLKFIPTDVAERFVGKMVRDLADGGRLVAVMPTTMLDAPTFKTWLRENGTVRAIIKSPPGAYDTRATSVESVLLVFDKVKPASVTRTELPAVVVTETWEEYAQAVEGIHARPALEPAAEGRPAAAPAPAPERRPEHVPERQGSELAQPGRNPPVPGGRHPGVVAEQPGPAAGSKPAPARPPVVEQPERATADALTQSAGEFTDVVDHTADERRAAAGSRQFAPYVRRSTLRGVGHPKLIVEARQLAGVPYPRLTEKPGAALTTALREQRVSIEQVEQALAAIQANVVGHHGYLAADNVGLGKSREIALTVIELMERAKADDRELRLVLTTKSTDNIADLIDTELYYVATGRTRDGRDLLNVDAPKVVPPALDFEIVRTAEWPDAKREGTEYKPLPQHKRAVYVTDFYNLAAFRQALVDVGPHGIVGDEAHRFKNVEGAAAGGAWQNLHAQVFRNVAREEQVFAYFTATPAQEVSDYQYLYGLRLWPIDGFADWVKLVTGQSNEAAAKKLQEATDAGAKDIDAVADNDGAAVVGGDAEDVVKTDKPRYGRTSTDVFATRLTPAEAEQIPREWKMLGRFSARDLWRAGQEFTVHEAKLAPRHAEKYDQFVALAQEIAKAAYKFGLFDKSGKSSRFGVTGQLQFAAKRIQMQPALEEAITVAKEKVAQGYQVVLSVLNVSEMDPEKGNIAAAIEKINTRMKDVDPDDPDGGTIDQGEIPEALIAKAELLEQAKLLGKFDNPVTMVADAFGPDKVAFIIGDSGASRRVAMREFQEGKRPVAFLSQAGSTGINLDHRVLTDTKPGRGRRVFIDVQFEWSATEAIQRYGRVGRSASVTQPILMPLTFGNASEKKFLATIANRMAALGALSKGGAETTGAAGLEEFEISGPDATAAARLAYNDLPEDAKRQFAVIKSVFRSPNRDNADPFEPAATAPASAGMRDYQLALLFVPLPTSNAFWQSFIAHREKVRETLGHATASRTEALMGDVLRTTDLGTPDKPLTLTEVKNQKGQRYGILSGLITPRMPQIREFLYVDNPDNPYAPAEFKRRYVTFTAGDQIISGLQIPWGKVKPLADAFGHALQGEKLDTPEKVAAALKAGEKVPLTQETDGVAWILRQRQDGKIAIEHAKMADRTLLLHNGAGYSPVGNFWFVKPDALAQFLERFPAVQPAAKPTKGGPTLQATVLPGAAEFGEYVVEPVARAIADEIRKNRDDLVTLFAPDTLSTHAERGAGVLRANLAARAQRTQRAQRLLRSVETLMDRWTHDQSLQFWDVMEGLQPLDTLDADTRATADLYRDILDRKRDQVVTRGLLRNYLEHYWGHEWARGTTPLEALVRKLFGRRPLQGPESYRKRRSIPTMREGLDLGLQPLSWNPTTQLLRKLLEMDKSIAAHDIKRELRARGEAKMIAAGKKLPDGWSYYPESFGTVYGPQTFETRAGEAVRIPFGKLVAGRYAGPAETVRLLENHLSPGLRGKSALFDTYRYLGNFLNQLQLSFSAFHFMMTGMESVVSKQSLVFEQIARGQVGAAVKSQAAVPIAPILDVFRGHKALKAFYAHDANAALLDDLVGQIVNAGGGFGWDLFEHSGAPAAFMRNLRAAGGAVRAGELGRAAGQLAAAGARTIPALVELSAKPIMEGWVPRLKIAAFLDLAAMELQTLGPRPNLEEARRVLGAAWDSIDNRFGELRYDNLFWHNALKDLGMASVRALGWNIGTVREMFGVPFAQARQLGLGSGGGGFGKPPVRLVNTGGRRYEPQPESRLHRKTAWFVAMILCYGLAGAIYMYLRTGKRPADLKDYFFPQNGETDSRGRPVRVSIAGYFKDLYHAAHALPGSAFETAKAKVHPLLTMIADIVSNEDFFGNEIRSADDPLVTQLRDVMLYVLKESTPISVTQAQQHPSRSRQVESFFGITKAPRSVTDSALEQYLHDLAPPAHRTKEQAAQASERRAIREAVRTPGAPRPDVSHLSPQSIKQTAKTAMRSPLAAQIGSSEVSLRQALHAYELATPDERLVIRGALSKKVPTGLAKTPPDERGALMAEYRRVIALPIAARAVGQ